MKRTLTWFRSKYLSIDLRSLAAGRIALASALLVSLFRRVCEFPYFYTNDGLLPNHAVLWSPVYPYELSFFLCLSHSQEVFVGFIICFTAFLALLVGYHTRAAQIASFLCAMSLRNRVPSLLNSGDIVLGLLAFWTMFLPVGRRYSVDAARERVRHDSRDSEVQTHESSVVSLGAIALLLQLAAIYSLNYLQKDGETWTSGAAVHYTLHQDRLVTFFGVWLREHLNSWQSIALTRFTLFIEAIIPLCILSPVRPGAARRLAALLIVVLHSGFGLCLNLGAFAPAMIAFGVHLVPGKDWDRVAALADRMKITAAFHRLAERVPPIFTAVPGSRSLIPISEIVLAASIVVAGYQLLRENRWFSQVRPPENQILDAAVIYLGLFQGWSLFAPEAPKTDLNVSVDAVTQDGRHVDPLNLVASANHKPGLRVPSLLDQSALFSSYIAHVPKNPQFNSMFIDWIGRYHMRTGRAGDRIVSFDAYIVEDDSPLLGRTSPTNTRWSRFITHRF